MKLRVTGLCERNSPVTGEFPAQRASNAENASIWWCHHDSCLLQNSPLGKESSPWPSPWGGASAMCTQIFVAFSRQFSLSRACQASATASGVSPPPEAEAASSQVFISFTDDVKSLTRVRKLLALDSLWSRYSMRARWMSDFSLATISSTIRRMFCRRRGSLLWRYNGHNGVWNHQPHDCLLNCSFRPRSTKTSNLRVTGLCAGNLPVTGEFPAQKASNAENVSIWWRHHVICLGEVWSNILWKLVNYSIWCSLLCRKSIKS